MVNQAAQLKGVTKIFQVFSNMGRHTESNRQLIYTTNAGMVYKPSMYYCVKCICMCKVCGNTTRMINSENMNKIYPVHHSTIPLGHHQYINCFPSPPAHINFEQPRFDYLIKSHLHWQFFQEYYFKHYSDSEMYLKIFKSYINNTLYWLICIISPLFIHFPHIELQLYFIYYFKGRHTILLLMNKKASS